MKKRTKFAAIAATGFTALALSAAPASAVPDPGPGYGSGDYPSPNPAVFPSDISPPGTVSSTDRGKRPVPLT
ncbi:hypothetical protein ABIB35_001239 [Arthrobacter sp. UYP6]|uniref:hypothetical protein n=1 Tax=Arthrobacter sp. UYP6 TaxID=1756378 RepID=UPI00339AE2CE